MVYQRKKRTHEPEPQQQVPQVQTSLFASPDLETEDADNPYAVAGPTAAPNWEAVQRQIDNPLFDFGKISILPPDSAVQRQPVDPSTLSKQERFKQRVFSVQRDAETLSGPPRQPLIPISPIQRDAETSRVQTGAMSPLFQGMSARHQRDQAASPLSMAQPLLQLRPLSMQLPIQRDVPLGERSMPQTAGSAGENSVDLKPKGNGSPLPKQVTDNFVQSGYPEVKNARVHVDDAATQSIQAKAYTQNNDIVVQSSGANDPQLLGHEATHVVQQSQMALKPDIAGTPINANPMLEKNADENGERVARHEPVVLAGANSDNGEQSPSTVQKSSLVTQHPVSTQPAKANAVIQRALAGGTYIDDAVKRLKKMYGEESWWNEAQAKKVVTRLAGERGTYNKTEVETEVLETLITQFWRKQAKRKKAKQDSDVQNGNGVSQAPVEAQSLSAAIREMNSPAYMRSLREMNEATEAERIQDDPFHPDWQMPSQVEDALSDTELAAKDDMPTTAKTNTTANKTQATDDPNADSVSGSSAPVTVSRPRPQLPKSASAPILHSSSSESAAADWFQPSKLDLLPFRAKAIAKKLMQLKAVHQLMYSGELMVTEKQLRALVYIYLHLRDRLDADESMVVRSMQRYALFEGIDISNSTIFRLMQLVDHPNHPAFNDSKAQKSQDASIDKAGNDEQAKASVASGSTSGEITIWYDRRYELDEQDQLEEKVTYNASSMTILAERLRNFGKFHQTEAEFKQTNEKRKKKNKIAAQKGQALKPLRETPGYGPTTRPLEGSLVQDVLQVIAQKNLKDKVWFDGELVAIVHKTLDKLMDVLASGQAKSAQPESGDLLKQKHLPSIVDKYVNDISTPEMVEGSYSSPASQQAKGSDLSSTLSTSIQERAAQAEGKNEFFEVSNAEIPAFFQALHTLYPNNSEYGKIKNSQNLVNLNTYFPGEPHHWAHGARPWYPRIPKHDMLANLHPVYYPEHVPLTGDQTVYRGESQDRSPWNKTVQGLGGITAWAVSTQPNPYSKDIISHVCFSHYMNDSAYISTTTQKNVITTFGGDNGWFYTIQLPGNVGIDVNAHLFGNYTNEFEIAVPYIIPYSWIYQIASAKDEANLKIGGDLVRKVFEQNAWDKPFKEISQNDKDEVAVQNPEMTPKAFLMQKRQPDKKEPVAVSDNYSEKYNKYKEFSGEQLFDHLKSLNVTFPDRLTLTEVKLLVDGYWTEYKKQMTSKGETSIDDNHDPIIYAAQKHQITLKDNELKQLRDILWDEDRASSEEPEEVDQPNSAIDSAANENVAPKSVPLAEGTEEKTLTMNGTQFDKFLQEFKDYSKLQQVLDNTLEKTKLNGLGAKVYAKLKGKKLIVDGQAIDLNRWTNKPKAMGPVGSFTYERWSNFKQKSEISSENIPSGNVASVDNAEENTLTMSGTQFDKFLQEFKDYSKLQQVLDNTLEQKKLNGFGAKVYAKLKGKKLIVDGQAIDLTLWTNKTKAMGPVSSFMYERWSNFKRV